MRKNLLFILILVFTVIVSYTLTGCIVEDPKYSDKEKIITWSEEKIETEAVKEELDYIIHRIKKRETIRKVAHMYELSFVDLAAMLEKPIKGKESWLYSGDTLYIKVGEDGFIDEAYIKKGK
jgi:hypothetical protein